MWILILLIIPTIIMLIGTLTSSGKVTLKEFIISELLMVVIITSGYFIARQQNVLDTEIWNGWLTEASYYEEWWERVSCSHPIPCSHYDSKGNTEHMNDGYYHLYDVDYVPPYWEGMTSNGEVLHISKSYFERTCVLFKNREYKHIWRLSKDHGPGNKYVTIYNTGISQFIPTAVEYNYTNYIKASPTSVLRKIGQGEKFKDKIPGYPRVDDSEWKTDRFISVGISIPNLADLNKKISEINGRLGRAKQVNLIFIAVNTDDSSYIHSLEEKWLGGKKNDFVIVVGCVNYPTISWVRIMSWSLSEDLKIELRDKIQEIGSLEKGSEILSTIEIDIKNKFTRRPMADFEYLMAGWQPSGGILILLTLIGILVSIGLNFFFRENDIENF